MKDLASSVLDRMHSLYSGFADVPLIEEYEVMFCSVIMTTKY